MAILYVKDERGNKIPIPAIVGADGISPAVSISKEGGTTTITITDAQGVHTAIIEDGLDASQGGALPAPATAAPGQMIVVKAVDGNGMVTATEAVDMPTGGGNTVQLARTKFGAIVIDGNLSKEIMEED